jgi:hypothetical protein
MRGKETAQNRMGQRPRPTPQGRRGDGAIGLHAAAQFIRPSPKGGLRIIQVSGRRAKALREGRT